MTGTATNDQLHAAARYAWKALHLREAATALLTGTHKMSGALPAEAVQATAESMTAEADRIEAAAAAAEAELAVRRAAVPNFRGYVS